MLGGGRLSAHRKRPYREVGVWQLPWCLWLKVELAKHRGLTLSFHSGTTLPYVSEDIYSNSLHALSKTVKRSQERILTSAKHKLLITVLFRSLPFNSLDLTRNMLLYGDLESSHIELFKAKNSCYFFLFF